MSYHEYLRLMPLPYPNAAGSDASAREAAAVDAQPPSSAAADFTGETDESLQDMQSVLPSGGVSSRAAQHERSRDHLQGLHEDQTARETNEEGHGHSVERPPETARSARGAVRRSDWENGEARPLPVLYGENSEASSGRAPSRLLEAIGRDLGMPVVPRGRAPVLEAGELAAEPTISPSGAAADLSDGGVEGHALSQTSPSTQQLQDSRGPRGVHLAGVEPGPSEDSGSTYSCRGESALTPVGSPTLSHAEMLREVERLIAETHASCEDDDVPLFLRRA
jgi:hypothetical protein